MKKETQKGFKIKIENMTEDDLAQVRKLNNKYAEAVGECSFKMYQYLFSIAQHALVVRD